MKRLINFLVETNKKGFFHVFTANIFFVIAAFGSQLFIAKILTDTELGYIKIFQSYTQILSILAGLGFSTSVLVICSNPNNKNRTFETLQVAIYAVIPISILMLFLFIFLNYYDFWTNINQVKLYLNNYSYIILFTVISATLTAFIQAARIFKKFSYIIITTKVTSIIITVIFTYYFGVKGFFQGLAVGLFFSLIINSIFTKKQFHVKFSFIIKDYFKKAKEQLSIGLHGLGANLFGILASNFDIILMGYFLVDNSSLLGQYGFASIFFTGLGIIQSTIVQVAVPYFGKHINNKATTIYLLRKYNIILFIASIILLVILYLFLPVFIQFIYSNKYSTGVSFLILLLGVWFFKVNNSVNGAYFLASGYTKYTNLINFINAILTGLCVYFSLKFYTIETMVKALIIINFLIVLFSLYLVKISVIKMKQVNSNNI